MEINPKQEAPVQTVTGSPEQKITVTDTHHANNAAKADGIDPVRTVRELVGENAVLLPIPSRAKSPTMVGWQEVSLDETKTPEYERQLRAGNIGVLLGKPSAGLCAIDIDHDDAVEPFLVLNEHLRGTLRTHGARGQQIWIKVTGDYPVLKKITKLDGTEWGEWRADNGQSVIFGTHPSGVEYQVVNRATPVTTDLNSIIWPEDLKLPWVKTEYELLVEAQGLPYAKSEKGAITLNQMFFVIQYALKHKVLYDPVLGDFYEYDLADGLWKKQTEDFVKKQFMADFTEYAFEVGEPALLPKRNDGLASSLMRSLRGIVEKYNAFADKKPIIHVHNGVLRLDLDPAELQTFHPDFLSRNICPIDYIDGEDCPLFKAELLGTALDVDDISLLKRWAGAVLLGVNTAQRLLLLVGTAGGGKSTLMTILEMVIGMQNVAEIRTHLLGERFENFKFIGKTLLTGKDVDAGFLMSKGASHLKKLVGHDLVDVEKKGSSEQFQIIGKFNAGITTNSKLKVRLDGDTDAWRRRLMIISYEKPKPTKRIPNFAHDLIAKEATGILAWMVEGAMEHIQELNEIGDFRLTRDQQKRIDQLLDESDSVRRFLETQVAPDEALDVTKSELATQYFQYCEDKAWQPYGSNEFTSKLSGLMLEIHRAAERHDIKRKNADGKEVAQRGYKGVTILRD